VPTQEIRSLIVNRGIRERDLAQKGQGLIWIAAASDPLFYLLFFLEIIVFPRETLLS
jgi:hypothetical protein